MDVNNPLSKFYNDPTTYVKLPTRGNFYKEKPNLSIDGDIGILPMTAIDEMMFQSPDNLLNGESLFKVIGRCAPDVKNPKEIPTPDLDVILAGIRIATYGDKMDVGAVCPNEECGHENEFQVDLSALVAGVQFLEDTYSIEFSNGISCDVKPFTVQSSIMMSLYAIEIKKLQQSANTMDNSHQDQLIALIKQTLDKSSRHLIDMMTECVLRVSIPDADSVENPAHIREWVSMLTARDYKALRGKIEDISQIGMSKTTTAKCTKCNHMWETEIGVDPASFFDMR